MALIADVNVAGQSLVSYNLHLESRGDASLRCSQLQECLNDSRQYRSGVPILLAGDLNLDIVRTSACSDLSQAQFRNAFAGQHIRTTPARSPFDRGSSIDWILTRGSVSFTQTEVHRSVAASDHYPLSLTLEFV